MNKQLKNGQHARRSQRSVLLTVLLLQLSACQTTPILKVDAHVDNRLANPTVANEVPQKIRNVTERETHINRLVAHAERAWDAVDFDEVERILNALEAYDPGNLRANEGMLRLELARKHEGLISEAQSLMGASEENDDKAKTKLHEVLLENPQHVRASKLYKELLQTQEKNTQERLNKKLAFNQPVTMEFKDMPLKSIFEALSKNTKINFIIDKDVPSDQKATIFVKSMAFKDAFDLLLQTNQLEKKILSENSVIVYVNDPLHQRDYKDLIVRSFTLEYADAKQMSAVLRSMLNIRQIEIDTRLNSLIIRESAEVLQLAEQIILAQDLPDAEVMLEMQVLEVARSNVLNLGVNLPQGVSVLKAGTGSTLTVKDLTNITGNTLQVLGDSGVGINIGATKGDVNLLANPRIRVKNRELAKIHIGQKVPVFTSNVASTGVTTQTVQYIDTGLKLEVEPNISISGDVTIKINLNVGSIGDKPLSSNGGSAFVVGTRLATTQLRLHDGETQILAGLIDDQDRKNVSGIPGLADIPLLGRLFSSHKDDKTKTEIILSITPHIIRERRLQTSNQAEMRVGSEGQAGRRGVSPGAIDAKSLFIVPKAVTAPAPKAEKPQDINIPLPPSFSLGNGLAPAPKVEE